MTNSELTGASNACGVVIAEALSVLAAEGALTLHVPRETITAELCTRLAPLFGLSPHTLHVWTVMRLADWPEGSDDTKRAAIAEIVATALPSGTEDHIFEILWHFDSPNRSRTADASRYKSLARSLIASFENAG